MKNKKNGGVWTGISFAMLALLLASEGWGVYRLLKIRMIPGKYLAVLLALAVIVTVPVIIMMFPRQGKWQKSKGHGRRITAWILALVIALLSLLGGFAVSKLDRTVDAVTQIPEISAQVGVYVNAGDPALTVKDAGDYVFGYTDSYDPENTRTTVAALEELLGKKITLKAYDTVFSMVDGLYEGQVGAIILNSAYVHVMDEAEGYTDFGEKTRELWLYDVMKVPEPTEKPTKPTKPQETKEPAEPTKPKKVTETPFLMYLSGSDTRSTFLATSRNDVNILAAVNPVTKKILLVNTPRDYFVPNPAGDGALDKLTHCGIYGVECSAQALEDLYGVPVSYYAQINFTGFETLIDAIGGVTIYSDFDDGVWLRAGENYMDGKTALNFARDRHDYAAGDNARGQHQMQVITAVVHKLTSGSMITNYSQILDSLQGMFQTNMPSETIAKFIKMQLDDMASWDIESFAVTGTGGSDIPYSMPGLYAYVMYPDYDVVAEATAKIQAVLSPQG